MAESRAALLQADHKRVFPSRAGGEAWSRSRGFAKVGVIDTGIEVTHPDHVAFKQDAEGNIIFAGGNFREHLARDFLFDDTCSVDELDPDDGVFPTAAGHGTHVSGLVAAATDNGLGTAGACWHCSLLVTKAAPANTVADEPLGCPSSFAPRFYQGNTECGSNIGHALFPESELPQMQAAGYISQPGLEDWIGYVYPNVDSDGDFLIDGFESLLGTDPAVADSDCDGESDGQEALFYDASDPNPALHGYGDPQSGPCALQIFADGFEMGSTGQWSSTVSGN